MLQIQYVTAKGAGIILYPKSQAEVKEKLRRLAYRRIESNLINVTSIGYERVGGTEPLDASDSHSKYIWFYHNGVFEGRL